MEERGAGGTRKGRGISKRGKEGDTYLVDFHLFILLLIDWYLPKRHKRRKYDLL